MTILHVTDFHFHPRWLDWLLRRAPAHDLVVMSGDMLDLASATPHRKQITWVSGYPRAMSAGSWSVAGRRTPKTSHKISS